MYTARSDLIQRHLFPRQVLTDPGGPAMTWGVFSVGWLDLDQDQKAAELFTRSYRPYVRQPFKVRGQNAETGWAGKGRDRGGAGDVEPGHADPACDNPLSAMKWVGSP